MSRRHVIRDVSAFGRVAVLVGGRSAEREISLISGAAVLEALRGRGVDAHAVDTAEDAVAQLSDGRFDRVWNALHGTGGEDGRIQGALEFLGVPYTGTGVLGSALSIDKLRSKQLFRAAGFGTPAFEVLRSAADCDGAVRRLGLPLFIKPARQGSSVGMHKVERAADCEAARQDAARYDDIVLAEAFVAGAEYTLGILQGEALPMIRIETPRSFYDYEAKYHSDSTSYHCPCGLAAEQEALLAAESLRLFETMACHGWGRVDFLLGPAGEALFLEVNTIPGMTSHSLVPMAAQARGIDFGELVWRILETSFDQAPGGAA